MEGERERGMEGRGSERGGPHWVPNEDLSLHFKVLLLSLPLPLSLFLLCGHLMCMPLVRSTYLFSRLSIYPSFWLIPPLFFF